MAVPTSREEFKAYCLRKLGFGVISINISDEQIEDRIDEALQYYWMYHFDGSDKIYYKHAITATDIENKYIVLPENIIGAVSVFSLGDPMMSNDDMFNIRYQIALNDLYTLTSVSMVPYYMVMQHLSLLDELLVGKTPIRYARHKNRLYVDMNWQDRMAGQYLLVEAYEIIDPEIFTDGWGDRWLQNYTTLKLKEQWGSNLCKYLTVSLAGGQQFNGEKIYNDAITEIAKMEDTMVMRFSAPVLDLYG